MAEAKFAIELDEKKGRVLVTKQPLNQGELILEEKPLVHGLSRDSSLVCLSCYDSIDQEDPYACEKCGLPLCSESCQDSARHLPECTAIHTLGREAGRNLSLTLLGDSIPNLMDVIMILRCLWLRNSSNDEWFKLNQLQAFSEDSVENDEEHEEFETVMNQVLDCLMDNFAHLDLDRAILSRLYGVLMINAFEIPNVSGEASVAAVYATGCLPEHSCLPSCHKSFDRDLAISLRAAVPLEASQRISITYTDSLWPTAERRAHLSYSKRFHCDCPRCCDPTECGTYLSGLKCIKCPVGFYLSQDPLQDSSDWQCEDCRTVVPVRLVNDVYTRVANSIKALEENGLEPEACEKFIMVHSRVLHPQHAHMLDVKHSLLHILGHHEGYLMADLTDKQLQIKEDIARCILLVADKLIPGISRLRGTTLYELFLTYQQRGLNWYHRAERGAKDILSTFKTAEESLMKCIETLQYEPDHQPEGKLCFQAQEELQILRDFVNNLTN